VDIARPAPADVCWVVRGYRERPVDREAEHCDIVIHPIG
jgi:hypothetical protein